MSARRKWTAETIRANAFGGRSTEIFQKLVFEMLADLMEAVEHLERAALRSGHADRD